jgi:murein DD-endopeptidase MepM/ murein hydrolase activator NlpD
MVRRALAGRGGLRHALRAGAVAVAAAWCATPSASVPPPLTVSFHARALQPGEVVRLELKASSPLVRARAFAFGDDIQLQSTADPAVRAGLVGIDLSRAPGDEAVRVEATTSDGATLSAEERLTVAPKTFPTRHLRVDPAFVNPPASALPRIRREARRLAAIFAAATPETRWSSPFVPPVGEPANSRFGTRTVLNGEPRGPHTGADFPSPAGTPVRAPNDGLVVLADSLYFSGETVVVDHGAGLYSLFAHLSRMDVEPDQRVARGAVVGAVGATGRVTGPHLHWAVRLRGARVDPVSLLSVTSQGSGR